MIWKLVAGVSVTAGLSALIVFVVFPSARGPKSVVVTTDRTEAPFAKGLHFAAYPANGRKIVTDAVDRLRWESLPGKLPEVVAGQLVVGYEISNVESLIANANLDAEAKPTNGDFYLRTSTYTIGEVFAVINPDTGEFKPGGERLSSSTEVTDAIQKVAMLVPVRAGYYEARRLGFIWQGHPWAALWLKAAPGGIDLIYPFDSNATLQQGTLYNLPDYLAELRAEYDKIQQAHQASIDRLAAIIAGNQQKAAAGGDTTTNRLRNLQAALNTALDAIEKLPKGSFERPIADVIETQSTLAETLDYAKAHPEIDRMSPGIIDESVTRWQAAGLGFARARDPDFELASNVLRTSLKEFIGDPSQGRPIFGEMGGRRDSILRELATVAIHLNEAEESYESTISPTVRTSLPKPFPVSLPVKDSAHLGSISGTVVGSGFGSGSPPGLPAPYAIIAFAAVDALDWGVRPSGFRLIGPVNGAIPGTIADEKGVFVIRNVAPGFYVVNTGAEWVVVEVKADIETKLANPLILQVPGGGGAGG